MYIHMYISYMYIHMYIHIVSRSLRSLARLLQMCSVSTNGEQPSPAQQGFQMIDVKTLDEHANILESLPEYQELVRISVHK